MLWIVTPLTGAVAPVAVAHVAVTPVAIAQVAVTPVAVTDIAVANIVTVEIIIVVDINRVVAAPSTAVTPASAPHGTHGDSDAE